MKRRPQAKAVGEAVEKRMSGIQSPPKDATSELKTPTVATKHEFVAALIRQMAGLDADIKESPVRLQTPR